MNTRVHGEHGRDVYDLDGSSRKYRLLRKAVDPFVCRYPAVSSDLAQWLGQLVGNTNVVQVCNGVDVHRFYPRTGPRLLMAPGAFISQDTIVIGTVGRMETVKDQLTLVRAFLHLVQTDAESRQRLRLIMIGDGLLRGESLRFASGRGRRGSRVAPRRASGHTRAVAGF
jgi:glycosyltransferase involved in cell wall biosynthesis